MVGNALNNDDDNDDNNNDNDNNESNGMALWQFWLSLVYFIDN